ncbi:hypothetical protein B0H13DRAFT_2371764 [Mycena leptocephala]|nr:hypothetical protein B0H13DRAFT_2371764 [Mycena leptocephala]
MLTWIVLFVVPVLLASKPTHGNTARINTDAPCDDICFIVGKPDATTCADDYAQNYSVCLDCECQNPQVFSITVPEAQIEFDSYTLICENAGFHVKNITITASPGAGTPTVSGPTPSASTSSFTDASSASAPSGPSATNDANSTGSGSGNNNKGVGGARPGKKMWALFAGALIAGMLDIACSL